MQKIGRWVLMGALVASYAYADNTPPHSPLPVGDFAADFFESPASALRKIPRGFRVIALSHLAEAYASADAQGTVDHAKAVGRLREIVALSLGGLVRPKGIAPDLAGPLGQHGLYLAHLNIILATDAIRSGADDFRALHGRVAKHLGKLSDNPLAHAPSFSGRALRFPADQAALLHGLWLYDNRYGTELSKEPIKRWLAVMADAGKDKKSGLPRSELTGKTATSHLPRGCAMSFSARYMASFAPKHATALWSAYRQEFLVPVATAAGLREWPVGEERGWDIDSGPIVMGIGAAATGLGIAASRAVDDLQTHGRLLGTMDLVMAVAPADIRAAGDSVLAKSIALLGRTWVRWWESGD